MFARLGGGPPGADFVGWRPARRHGLAVRFISALIFSASSTACMSDPSSVAEPAVTASASTASPPAAPSSSVARLSGRAVHTTTRLSDGSAMVVGGCVIDGCGRASNEVFDLDVRGRIKPGPPLSTPRDGHSALLLRDGSVLVVGGFSGEGQAPLATSEIRRQGEPWRPSAALRLGRGGNAVALLGDGRPIVVGGWLGPGRFTATTEILDLRSGTFAPGPDLPQAADGLAAVTLKDGSVLVTGGQVGSQVATDMAVLISSDGRRVTTVPPLRQARFKHTMVVLPSGKVLVIGGTSDDRERLTSTEVFDPAVQTFRSGPTLVNGRYKLIGSAVGLPDGRVVVGGGGAGVEVVDVASGTSALAGAFGDGVAAFSTVTMLGADRILNLGGYDERIALTRTFETARISDLT